MDCEKCRNSKPVDKEQLIQDLIDYLDYIGVTKESMIASLIEIDARLSILRHHRYHLERKIGNVSASQGTPSLYRQDV